MIYVVDLGTQLYGRRKFAVYDTVGDSFVPYDNEFAFCCWRYFDSCGAEGYRLPATPWHVSRDAEERPLPGLPPFADWIPDDCGEHSDE